MAEPSLPADPIALFAAWFADAHTFGIGEPNAMVLATASGDGTPSARTVLLKGYGGLGFRFFTNLASHKGHDLRENPRAALVFPWHDMHRQVRVSGPVLEVSRDEVAAYFRTRPYGSRLGAWASERQSGVIEGREGLERRWAEAAGRWPDPASGREPGAPGVGGGGTGDEAGDEAVPLPDFWGGFRVVPASIEFWQGRRDRLHDRIRYRRALPGMAPCHPPLYGGAETEAPWGPAPAPGDAGETTPGASGEWVMERLSP